LIQTLLTGTICWTLEDDNMAHTEFFSGRLLTTSGGERTRRSYWSQKWQHVPMICPAAAVPPVCCFLALHSWIGSDRIGWMKKKRGKMMRASAVMSRRRLTDLESVSRSASGLPPKWNQT
jgi:hypothetical protein